MSDIIYLDNASTTFPKPESVYNFMDEFYRKNGVNAGRSSHKLSRIANDLIDDTRRELTDLVKINNKSRVVFTSSATVALNQVLNGLDWSTIKNVYVSPFEHNAIMRTLHYLNKKFDFVIHILDFNSETFELNTKALKPNLSQNMPDLVCVSHVSNVTGYILPIEQLTEILSDYNPIVILDCAQSMGLIDIDLNKLNIDYAIFAGHKTLYGPFGIAGYINNSNKVALKEFIVGGTGSDSINLNMPEVEPYMYEAGSYNIQAIAGLNAAIKWIKQTKVYFIYKKEKELTDLLVSELEQLDGIEIYIPKDRERHIGIVALNIDGYSAEDVARVLDEEFNIAVRAGHHCAPYFRDFINIYEGTVRVSLGYFNDKEQIKYLIESLENL
ncbi:cysteine desulfurase [Clostridium polyendosporum]|uniref:Cysteine desulfurase n=1 Tax=Clostridium polyendosporum TaxID=69208 RepID=A0A919RYZ6_9CLOT|nr:aminotransferase class V-fold PLP-dependent enzyme [Clostridium polyendosporum]GIM28837.1 cysteine desulfurase [Clostridium polyendosporum]